MRPHFDLRPLLLAFVLAASVAAGAQERSPNIVVIVADDLGYADLGFQGSTDIPTPHLDALAASGVRFTNGYVTGPYCSPTRAGLMTGRYPQRFGHEFNIGAMEQHRDVGLPLTERTLADRLKAAGYRTAIFGKWHLGAAEKFRPMRRGFDEFYGFLAGAHLYFGGQRLDGDSVVAAQGYLTDAIADRSVEFIKRNSARPFFLYVAFNAVHLPMQATDSYLARFTAIADPQRRVYAAMLSAMDDGIGRVLATLRDQRVDDNTLIFFFADNGGPTIIGGVNGSSNAPLRGSKRQTWEGGIRVPFVMSWKGRIAANTVYSQPIIQLDVAPTALAAARVQPDSTAKFDGVNLLPFLAGRGGMPHETLYWRLGAMMAIRRGDWKLVKMHDRPTEGDPRELSDLSGAQLFDLKNDVSESRDLARARPEKASELADAWQRWTREIAWPAWQAPSTLRGPAP